MQSASMPAAVAHNQRSDDYLLLCFVFVLVQIIIRHPAKINFIAEGIE